MIRILQFSDIHFLCCNDTEDEYVQMRQRFKEDLECLKSKEGAIPYILICGDIANKGQKAEFDKARSYINELCDILKVDDKAPDVFVIPGNHDIDRKAYEKTRNLFREKLLNFEGKENEYFLRTLLHNEPDSIKILYSTLNTYNDFATEYSSVDGIGEKLLEGGRTLNFEKSNLFWKQPIGKIDNYCINLVGLNSALLCDGHEKEHPVIGKGEHTLFLPYMAYNIPTPSNEVNISMIHHPLNWLGNEKDVQTVFDERFKIQFYGHMHDQSSASDSSIKIYSGALQPPKDDSGTLAVYNYIEIDIENSVLEVSIDCRKWDGRKFCRYERESKKYSLSLKVEDEWNQDEKKKAQQNISVEETSIPKHEIIQRFRSLSIEKKRMVIEEMLPSVNKEKRSSHEKELFFIRAMRDSGRLNELYKKLINT